ncbi:nuclease SbcCD subunit C-like [Prorops nasuta]|uniref:nuclease SbcCD subunit C-like n=1 Tax=Prorops nasuta TaxID=863751 RepID=UPI0034CECEBB
MVRLIFDLRIPLFFILILFVINVENKIKYRENYAKYFKHQEHVDKQHNLESVYSNNTTFSNSPNKHEFHINNLTHDGVQIMHKPYSTNFHKGKTEFAVLRKIRKSSQFTDNLSPLINEFNNNRQGSLFKRRDYFTEAPVMNLLKGSKSSDSNLEPLNHLFGVINKDNSFHIQKERSMQNQKGTEFQPTSNYILSSKLEANEFLPTFVDENKHHSFQIPNQTESYGIFDSVTTLNNLYKFEHTTSNPFMNLYNDNSNIGDILTDAQHNYNKTHLELFSIKNNEVTKPVPFRLNYESQTFSDTYKSNEFLSIDNNEFKPKRYKRSIVPNGISWGKAKRRKGFARKLFGRRKKKKKRKKFFKRLHKRYHELPSNLKAINAQQQRIKYDTEEQKMLNDVKSHERIDENIDAIKSIIKREISGIPTNNMIAKERRGLYKDRNQLTKTETDSENVGNQENAKSFEDNLSKGKISEDNSLVKDSNVDTSSVLNRPKPNGQLRIKRNEGNFKHKVKSEPNHADESKSSKVDAMSKQTADEIKELSEEIIAKVNNLQNYFNGCFRMKRGRARSVVTKSNEGKKAVIEKCRPLKNAKISSGAVPSKVAKGIGEDETNNEERFILDKNIPVGRRSSVNSFELESELANNARRKRKSRRKWDRWTDWSSCSVTCGKGRQIRWRHCLRDCYTAETEMEEKACQLPACPPGKFLGIFK